jgi:hypothetical protein
MRMTIFYLLVVPSVLAFFLGYMAHGLKTMAKIPLIGSQDSPDKEPIESKPNAAQPEQSVENSPA